MISTRLTSTARLAKVLPVNTLVYDITINVLFIGDGITLGGVALAPVRGVNSATKTSTYSISINDSGIHFNNLGALGPILFYLPPSLVEVLYTFDVITAQQVLVSVDPNGSDLIVGDVFNQTTIQSNLLYSCLTLKCTVSGFWLVDKATGTWS